ncbi:MAG: DNA topoisomerase III [Chlamydiales bacterium]|nr:DNA topoisomerase III [Chlamydiales bacterium]
MAKKKKAAKKRAPAKRKTVARKRAAPKKKSSGKRKSGLTQTTYSLSPELASIVGGKSMTRPQVVKKLWVYIKAKKLQDAKNRRMICPDSKLAEVIGSRPVDMLKLAGLLSKHIK